MHQKAYKRYHRLEEQCIQSKTKIKRTGKERKDNHLVSNMWENKVLNSFLEQHNGEGETHRSLGEEVLLHRAGSVTVLVHVLSSTK